MTKISSQSSKRKSSGQKRVAISERHASTPLRRRFVEDMELHKEYGLIARQARNQPIFLSF